MSESQRVMNPTIDRFFSDVSTPAQMLARCKESGLGEHPFFTRADSADLRYIWLIFRYAPFKDNQLALMTAMIENTPSAEIRECLVGQMKAETGDGDPAKSHLTMQENFLLGLAPWATEVGAERMAAARQAMNVGLERLFAAREPLRSLGGYLAGEVSFGCHIASYVIRVSREKGAGLSGKAAEWVSEHEVVEDEHQTEALRCATLVEREHSEHLGSFLAGGREMLSIMWAYYDALGSVRF